MSLAIKIVVGVVVFFVLVWLVTGWPFGAYGWPPQK